MPFGDAGLELNRELGKIGVGHTLDREKLLLDSEEKEARCVGLRSWGWR